MDISTGNESMGFSLIRTFLEIILTEEKNVSSPNGREEESACSSSEIRSAFQDRKAKLATRAGSADSSFPLEDALARINSIARTSRRTSSFASAYVTVNIVLVCYGECSYGIRHRRSRWRELNKVCCMLCVIVYTMFPNHETQGDYAARPRRWIYSAVFRYVGIVTRE